MNSNFPNPYAFVLFVKVEEDKNIVENYLRKGSLLFPDNSDIMRELFLISTDKQNMINKVKNSNFIDFELLRHVIGYLIDVNQWEDIEFFINKVQNNDNISRYDDNFLNLMKGYSYLFRQMPEYKKAINILMNVIDNDIDNNFLYAHFLGIIYAFINICDINEASKYFDKIPLQNKIHDLNSGPWYPILVDFRNEYKKIFLCIFNAFSNDKKRKNKAKGLYALYLYSPSNICDEYRYTKSDIRILEQLFKVNYNKEVAEALFHMHCHYKNYYEANDIFFEFLTHSHDPEIQDVSYIEIFENATDEIFDNIIMNVMNRKSTNSININLYIKTVFDYLIDRLYKAEKYLKIVDLANQLSINQIMTSESAFECAFSYKKCENDEKAQTIYKQIVEQDSTNSAAINNLGVIYDQKGDYIKAFDCFSKAHNISPENVKYSNNMSSVRKKLNENEDKIRKEKQKEIKTITKNINLNYFEDIGYTDELKAQLQKIKDKDLQEILLRDLRECVICISTKQNKAATIMCGSIIEALLLAKILEIEIIKYDISDIKSNKNSINYAVTDMGLNELLYVAEKENLICECNYHLSHYARDFRNVVHPSKEIRSKQTISHQNVLMMWEVLKRLIFELLK